MNLQEFETLVVETDTSDWTHFACWGAGSAPSFKDKITAWKGSFDSELSVVVESHSDLISLKSNLLISVAWGITHNDDFHEKWANSFPDPKASSCYVDFFYSGNLVYRDIAVTVDGGRCHLPLPDVKYSNDSKIESLTISNKQHHFFRLLNSLISGHDFDKYINDAQISTIDRCWMA